MLFVLNRSFYFLAMSKTYTEKLQLDSWPFQSIIQYFRRLPLYMTPFEQTLLNCVPNCDKIMVLNSSKLEQIVAILIQFFYKNYGFVPERRTKTKTSRKLTDRPIKSNLRTQAALPADKTALRGQKRRYRLSSVVPFPKIYLRYIETAIE